MARKRPPPDLETILRAIDGTHIEDWFAFDRRRTAEKLDALLAPRRPPAPERAPPDVRLLSAREAARRLGVSRGATIAELIAAGKLRTVRVNGRERIPASEVERLAREGFDARQSAPRRRRAP
jgi:excisionase family DNA binding protein